MIPKIANVPRPNKFFLLEEGDDIYQCDQYYNPFTDQWLPVQDEFVGYQYSPDESKPVRRPNAGYKS